MGVPSTATRMGTFHNSLGTGRLLLRRFFAREAVNAVPEYRVEVLDTDPNVNFEDLLGKAAHAELDTIEGTGNKRYFSGVITDCEWTGPSNGMHGYTITVRPSMHLMKLRRNQRIFHEMSVSEIVKQVMQDYGILPDWTATVGNETLHYVVQYRETDYDFVCRLLELAGANFFILCPNGPGTEVHIVDENDRFEQVDAHGGVQSNQRQYLPGAASATATQEHFWSWTPSRRVFSGKVKLTDFNFLSPNAKMVAEATGHTPAVNDKNLVYDFPGQYLTSSVGKDVAKVRAEQEGSVDHRHYAEGDCLTLSPGMRFKLTNAHPGGATGKEYICLEAYHAFTNADFATGGSNPAEYTGSFVMYPKTTPYRPPMHTPEARIDGPQTAIVVGKKGEEIDVDEYGRILVHFPWDLDNEYSMRVRVAQLWAGKNWGATFWPRIGHEVVIVFIEGDPRNPLCVGSVYNGANKPTHALPAKKNIGGIRSRSTKSGGADNYNEIYFDDTKGSELFNQQAERDLETLVKRCEKRDVWVDRNTYIGQDEYRKVKRDEKHEIEGKQEYFITKDVKWEIKQGDETHDVKLGKRTTTIQGNETQTVKQGNFKQEVKMGKHETKVSLGAVKRTVSLGTVTDKVSVGHFKTTVSLGNITTKASVGKIKLQAGTSIELVCGGSKIKMDPGSITISSPSITIDGKGMTTVKGGQLKTEGGIVEHKAKGTMTIKAPMTTVKGDGLLILKGGVVMIN